MAGQLTQYGAEFLANKLSGQAVPYVSATAPSSWIVGQEWIDTAAGNAIKVYDPETTSWVTGPYDLYLSLLIGDPSTAGPDSGLAQTIAQIAAVEDTTSGYMRQPFEMGTGTAAQPSVIANTNILTYTYSANQATQVSWAALLAIPAASSDGYTPLPSSVLNGLLMYYWILPVPQQVQATQSIQIAAGTFQIGLT